VNWRRGSPRPGNFFPARRVNLGVIMCQIRIGGAAARNPPDAEVIDGRPQLVRQGIHAGVARGEVDARHQGARHGRFEVARQTDRLVSAVSVAPRRARRRRVLSRFRRATLRPPAVGKGQVVPEEFQLLVALDVLFAQRLVLLFELAELIRHPFLDASRLRFHLSGVVEAQLALLFHLALQTVDLDVVRVTLLRPCELLFHYSHLQTRYGRSEWLPAPTILSIANKRHRKFRTQFE
jgi:hypothetical protein